MSSTTEDYLKHIYVASESSGMKDGLVSLGWLAKSMGVTPGTVTTMMKHLQEAGLVKYFQRSGVCLSPRGQKEALEILRRHRLIELLLVEIIGLDWKYVHDEAEILEHAISQRLLNRIDKLLNYPDTDPHGDPIPGANGVMPVQEGVPLSEIRPPCELSITRVRHEKKQFLEFLSEKDLMPGKILTLIDRDEMAGTLTIVRNSKTSIISLTAAEMIQVTRISS